MPDPDASAGGAALGGSPGTTSRSTFRVVLYQDRALAGWHARGARAVDFSFATAHRRLGLRPPRTSDAVTRDSGVSEGTDLDGGRCKPFVRLASAARRSGPAFQAARGRHRRPDPGHERFTRAGLYASGGQYCVGVAGRDEDHLYSVSGTGTPTESKVLDVSTGQAQMLVPGPASHPGSRLTDAGWPTRHSRSACGRSM